GFDKEQVVVIKTFQPLGAQSSPFKEALRKNAAIQSVAGSHTLPGRSFNNIGFRPEGEKEGITLNLILGDYDLLETLKLEMRAGRFFSREFITDSLAMIINEKTVKLLGWNEPLGKHFYGMRRKFKVIGVVKDFHYESLHQTIRPMAILMLPSVFGWSERFISARVQTGAIAETLKFMQNTWETFAPGVPFEYSFLDEDYERLYHNEQRTGKVFTFFSSLAILIACLGLFGLASFAAEQRTKEIGIRKVLGASVVGIVLMLSKEFTKWVLLANILAWPVAYYLMNNWLQNFAYRINIGGTIFIFSAILALAIAVLTVSFQAFKAAVANPVDALKYE
ncbi:MAG: ABC transporter permease, partial [bacterium]